MLMLVATIVGIGILLVAIGTGVPYLRGSLVTQTADAENPNGIAVSWVFNYVSQSLITINHLLRQVEPERNTII